MIDGLERLRFSLFSLMQYAAERSDMIRYPQFRAKHWQIGSGPTEAERKTTTLRVKGRGRRWESENAEAMMALAAVHDSGMWKQRWTTLARQHQAGEYSARCDRLAQRRVADYVRHYSEARLHSAIGYLTPADKLAGLEEVIFVTRRLPQPARLKFNRCCGRHSGPFGRKISPR